MYTMLYVTSDIYDVAVIFRVHTNSALFEVVEIIYRQVDARQEEHNVTKKFVLKIEHQHSCTATSPLPKNHYDMILRSIE